MYYLGMSETKNTPAPQTDAERIVRLEAHMRNAGEIIANLISRIEAMESK